MLSVDLLAHYRQISRHPLTVVDVETTGSLPYKSRIMEISVLQATLADGILHQQTDLVNPETPIPARITQITGIQQDMVDQVAPASEVLPHYWPLLQTGVLTAHNLSFDYPFLRMEAARLGTTLLRLEQEQLCTVQLSRLMLADLPSRSLPNLVQHFQFNIDTSHRAEADTRACWLLAQRLLTEILNEDDAHLLARFGQQWVPLKEAVKLLGCSSKVGRSRLEAAKVDGRLVGKGKISTHLYRRKDVERVFWEYQSSPV